MNSAEHQRQQDLVLDPNQYAYVQDQTSGQISCYRGPSSSTISAQDFMVRFDPATKSFIRCEPREAVAPVIQAREGEYVVLVNPDKEGRFPTLGTNKDWDLSEGHTVNIPGPVSFGLWPGQSAEVIPGHALKSNEYLVVEVYRSEDLTIRMPSQDEEGEELIVVPTLNVGQLLIIRGTETSFYIPPTGIKVVPDRDGNLIRSAITLEMLEYCVLLDESGEKRYVEGPTVVFPEPTEVFVESEGHRVFKAMELNELQGIYVTVSQAYEEGDTSYEVGQELFITGKQTRFYIPRNEHTIVQYGDRIKHYAVAIPKGEARYLMARHTGDIKTVKGPMMYLANPIEEVFVKRALRPKLVELLYPGNREAVEYNESLKVDANLMAFADDSGEELGTRGISRSTPVSYLATTDQQLQAFAGHTSNRGTSHTEPRQLSLETSKYEGAPTIDVWPGYAVYLLSKDGSRRVVQGPSHVILNYDEEPFVLSFSSGTPKTSDQLLRTTYLKVKNNKVSDRFVVESQDLVNVEFHLTFLVNFEESEEEKWFSIENYTQFLTHRVRSMLRSSAKKVDLLVIHNNPIEFVRNSLLSTVEEHGEGLFFIENSMVVRDVDVREVKILNKGIENYILDDRHSTLSQGLRRAQLSRDLELTKFTEDVNRKITAEKVRSDEQAHAHELASVDRVRTLALERVQAQLDEQKLEVDGELVLQDGLVIINEAKLGRKQAEADQRLAVVQSEIELELSRIVGEAEAFVTRVGAVDPQLTTALQAFADKHLLAQLAESMAPLAILGGESVVDVIRRMVDGTPLSVIVNQLGESPLGAAMKSLVPKAENE